MSWDDAKFEKIVSVLNDLKSAVYGLSFTIFICSVMLSSCIISVRH